MNTKRFLPFFLLAMLPVTFSGVAVAQVDQDTSEDDSILEEVIVTGVRFSMTEAVELKRNSIEIVDSIVAMDIGRFPDNNLAEALQRIPGVQVTNRGAGEVSSVSIRGLSDVTTTVNGRNIFTASGRAVALADIPATLVKQIDVYKTRSPSQISRGLAGQIDVKTNRPFDFEGLKLAVQAKATYQEQADKVDPNFSFLLSNTWDTDAGKFGALVNLSWAKTRWLDQGVHAGASVLFKEPDAPVDPFLRLFPPAWTPGLENGMPTAPGSTLDDGTPYVHSRDAMFQPHVNGERKRPAFNVSLQWAPNDTSEYTFEMFYNGFRNDQHNSLFFTFADWWGSVDTNDPVQIHPGTNVVRSRYVNFPYEFISGDNLSQDTDSYLYALAGKWDLTDDLNLRSEVVYQDSTFKDSFFALRADKVSPRLFVDFNPGNGIPFVEFFDDINTPQDESDLTDASQWNLAQLYDNGSKDKGDAFTWTADADWGVDWGWIDTISFGTRYDDRNAEENGRTAEGFVGGPSTAFDGLMGVTRNHFDGQANVLTEWAIPTQGGLISNAEALRAAGGIPSASMHMYENEFNIKEKQWALYLQADFYTEVANGFIDGRFGVRWVDQKTDMSFPNPDTGGTSEANNSNNAFLPSVMVRYGFAENWMVRASYTETFELPTFPQLSPYIQYFPDVTDIGYGTAAGGNPDLKPVESDNWDISLEWYFAEGSVLYATWFNRDITGNIVPFRKAVQYNDPDDDPDLGDYTYILSQPDNAGNSSLDGWEFGLTWFPELPGLWDGLGIQASYTILNSDQEIPVVDSEGNFVEYDIQPIGGVSDSSYSVILAYDRPSFNMRLSYFWRDDFYDRQEAPLFANPLQIWKSSEKSLDFQLNWIINEKWSLLFDGTNLTEEIYHENYGNQPVVFNHVNNLFSRTFSLGLRYTL